MDSRYLANMIPNLTGTDILPFPAKRVADTVRKFDPTRRILKDQIPSPLEEVSLLENVPEELLLRRFLVMEVLGKQTPIANTTDSFTFLAQFSPNAEPGLRVPVRHLGIRIVPDDKDIILEKSTNGAGEADSPRSPDPDAKVVELGHSLG